ncbi:hypothetical protein J5834_06455 [bacterium]|nr:hypothetical protein [bacterium]
MKNIFIFSAIILLFATLSARSEFNETTIKAELRKPGVKLVAIDFYMTGCKPCDAAIPVWKKLKEEYGDALKLIVVAPQRDDGSCSVKDWHPDKMICDEDTEIAEAWGVKDFPQAFLYSWHNNDPLVKLGHVKDVEKAIKKYFKTIPRVALDADDNCKDLLPMVEEALITNSKIEVVANESEHRKLMGLRKESHKLNYDEDSRCELGKEISANSILKITKQKTSLSLKLSSAEKSCTMASATKVLSGKSDKLKTEIAGAVYDLLSQMFGEITTPDFKASAAGTQKSGEKFQDNQACLQSRAESTVGSWEEYLNTFTAKGVCAEEAKTNIANLKNKPGNWSNKAPKKMDLKEAERYCKDLVEDGHDDWRLPNISEFREIALNCPKLEPKGECPIKKSWRSKFSWSITKCTCNAGAHSKLGDSDVLWSSTRIAFVPYVGRFVFSSSAGILEEHGGLTPLSVRCIRDEK